MGIDIFLDKKAKPWLIEVNQSPSFMTDSPLDDKVKRGVLVDAINMLNLNWRRKNRYVNNARVEKHRRLTGMPRASKYEQEEIRQKKIRIKDKFELNNLGDYERCYPLHPDDLKDNEENMALQAKYDELVVHSKDIYAESAAGGFQKKKDGALDNKIALRSPDKTKKDSHKMDGLGNSSGMKKTQIKFNGQITQ